MLLMGFIGSLSVFSSGGVYEGPSVILRVFTEDDLPARQTQIPACCSSSVTAQTCPAWCCLALASRALSSETSKSVHGVTIPSRPSFSRNVSQCYSQKSQAAFSHLLKVRRRGPRELGDRHVGLAVTVGDRDWLLLLHLRGGTAELDRSSPSPAGHCQRQHRACPSGQSLHMFALKFSRLLRAPYYTYF